MESLACVQKAEKLFYVCDAVTAKWLSSLNKTAESLEDCYAEGKDRHRTYNEMTARIMKAVHAGQNVCAAFYGHPGVLVNSGHQALRRARREGYDARMLPGVSAEDCLIADLGFDLLDGCQSYEATDFVTRKRRFDTTAVLILWQIAAIGVGTYSRNQGNWSPEGLELLARILLKSYPRNHRVVVYRAVPYPMRDPDIQRIPLSRLTEAHITPESTLFIPPAGKPDVDEHALRQLRHYS